MKADVPPVPKLRIPAWVPEPVREYARRTYENFTEPSRRSGLVEPIATRYLITLATDRRMRGVWRELARQHSDGSYLHPARVPGENAEIRQGRAMVTLFDYAVLCATSPGKTTTKRDVKRRCDKLLAKAKTLFIDADVAAIKDMFFAGTRSIMTKERYKALLAAALVYHEIALEELRADMALALDRDAGDHVDRWMVRALADKCRELFGSAQLGTVATIVSIVREREINPRTARQWGTMRFSYPKHPC